MKNILIACCLAWGTLHAQTSGADEAYRLAYQQGIEALNRKEVSAAILQFQKAAKLQPNYTETHLRLLQCALQKQDLAVYQQSMEALQRLQYKGLDARHYLALAQMARSQKNYFLAIDAAQKGRVLDQNNRDLLLVEALVYKDQQQWLTAIQRLEQAAINTKNTVIFNELADAYWKKGDKAKAIEHYEKTLDIDKGDFAALVALGQLYLERSQEDQQQNAAAATEWLKRAANYYERYWAMNPKDAAVMSILEQIYQTQGNQAGAESIRRQLLANH